MVNSQPLKDKVGPKVKLVKSVAYNAQYVGALTYHEAKEGGGHRFLSQGSQEERALKINIIPFLQCDKPVKSAQTP